MHRSDRHLVERLPGRLRSRGTALHRRGVAATYELHDRILSNRRSRTLHEGHRPSLDGSQRRIVKELDEKGFALASVVELLSPEESGAVDEQAEAFVRETESALTGGEAENLRRRAGKDFLVRKYDRTGVVPLDDPWLSACLSRRLLDVANEYLQLWSKLEYIDVWYSLPVGADAERRASQLWHRDFDDKRLLKAFLYLRNVDEQTGPFEYVPGSQPGGPFAKVRPWAPMGVGRLTEEELADHVPADGVRTFTAPKGTIIFCNTSGFHRGGFAESKPRLLATATYCSPASLASLTRRNYRLAPGSDTSRLDPPVRYALA